MAHLSYNEFQKIYGDIGLTYWVKYNWLGVNSLLPTGYTATNGYTFDGANYAGYPIDDYFMINNFNIKITNVILNEAYDYNSIWCSTNNNNADESWYDSYNIVNTRLANTYRIDIDNVSASEKSDFIYDYKNDTLSVNIQGQTGSSVAYPGFGSDVYLYIGCYTSENTPAKYSFDSVILSKNNKITHVLIPVKDSNNNEYLCNILTKKLYQLTLQ